MYWNMDMESRKTRMIETKEGGKSVHHCEYSAEAPVALPRENKRDDGALTKAHIVRFCCFEILLTTTVELESTLESDPLLGGAGLGVSLFGSVQSVDIGLVVLLVVKLHDLAGDVGLESIVGVRKVGESVARHVFCCVCVGGGRWRRVGMRETGMIWQGLFILRIWTGLILFR